LHIVFYSLFTYFKVEEKWWVVVIMCEERVIIKKKIKKIDILM